MQRPDKSRMVLMEAIGAEVVRFQDGTTAVDDAAATILAVDRADLPCITMLLFGGLASPDQLAGASGMSEKNFLATLERLELAGYIRRTGTGKPSQIEITDHARAWVEKIWGPLRDHGARLMAAYSTDQLAVVAQFLHEASAVQEKHVAKLRASLETPSARSHRARFRGGLSPAALQRVQVFVEANLARSIHLADLAARAGLSEFHFARAFKTSAGTTPGAFIEQRRIECAKRLLVDTADPLIELAAQTGFRTQSRFTTAFRLATGFTPGAYRRARR